jgi:hypothetical protein
VASRALELRRDKVGKAARMSGAPTNKAGKEASQGTCEEGQVAVSSTASNCSSDSDFVSPAAKRDGALSPTGADADASSPRFLGQASGAARDANLNSLLQEAVPAGIAAMPPLAEAAMRDAAASTSPLFMTPEGGDDEEAEADDNLSTVNEDECAGVDAADSGAGI